MSIEIRPAQSAAEAESVFRLRYEIYVSELGRVQEHADHAKRTIEEPLDASALLLVAFEGARLVGSVRVNYSSVSELGAYDSLYQMDRVGRAHPAHTSITTKMLVAPDYRNSPLAYRLAMTAYRTALCDGILYDFIDVYPQRVAFFERLGYRVHVPHAHHEEFGDVIVMSIATRDVAHLRAVGSPFLRHFVKFGATESSERRIDGVA